MVTQQISLYCSFCGKSIGPVAACPSCGADNVFLHVTPPDWVVEELADDTKLAPPVGQRRPRADPAVAMASRAAAPSPAPASSSAAQDEPRDDATMPLPSNDDRTVPIGAATGNPVVAVFICQDQCSPGQELRHELREGDTTVGRRGTQVVVPSEHVSKKHALVRIERAPSGGHRILLSDQGSGNGTFVNGEQLAQGEPREVRDNDAIMFANVRFILRVSEYLAPDGGPS